MANEEAFHLFLAAFIGVIGGLVNLVFLFLVNSIQWIVFWQSDSQRQKRTHFTERER